MYIVFSCNLFLFYVLFLSSLYISYLLYPRASPGRTWGWGSCSAHSPGTPSSPSPSCYFSTEDQRSIDQWVDQCSDGFTRRSVHHSWSSSSIRFTCSSIHQSYSPVDQSIDPIHLWINYLITTRSTYRSYPHVNQLIDPIGL